MLAGINRYRRILLVMALHIKLLLLVQLAGVDGGRNVLTTIAQHCQRIYVDVIIYEYD